MSELDALLAGIVSDPREETRWLVLADWLEENDQSDRAELLRLHRRLIATCLEPDSHPERAGWQARMVELLVSGVRPCVPQHTLTLPGGVPLTFSFIPPGAFLMGSNHPDASRDEKPVQLIELNRRFWLGACPVTQAQWTAVIGANPSAFKGVNRPVEQVSWDDCQHFCARINALTGHPVQLPDEAEWEFACRAGTTSEYYLGNVINTSLANYKGGYSRNGAPEGQDRRQTTDVDQFASNFWDLFDLCGNVWEWCQGRWRDYRTTRWALADPHPSSLDRVLRGGCWSAYPWSCRSASRIRNLRRHRSHTFGFRVCLRLD